MNNTDVVRSIPVSAKLSVTGGWFCCWPTAWVHRRLVLTIAVVARVALRCG
jgi:hypothetical protein